MLMKSRVFRSFALFIAPFMICLAPALAFGQWHPDSTENTRVCVAVGQQDHPQACSDGDNGAIIVWEDARAGVYQIYAQRIGSDGHAKWQNTGLKLANVAVGDPSQTSPIITTDDNGGAYVIWSDSRNSNSNGTCLFAQHIL